MRGAGCAWNDITDRNFDGKVERTRSRPIPSGDLSVGKAAAFMVLLGLIGLNILLQFNNFAIFIGLVSLVPVAIYPFMKRITWWPQLFLGLAFNWGALLGWAAVLGEVTLVPLLLYVGGIAWTLGYDTIYAHQDKTSDALLGVRSSALRLGSNSKLAIAGFYTLSVVALYLSAVLAKLSWPAFLGLSIGAAHFIWQIRFVNLDDPKSCLRMFQSNHSFAAIVFIGFIVG